LSSFRLSPLRAKRTSIPVEQLVEIVHMQRPAELEHDVVGDIHQRRDAALAGALQAPRIHAGVGALPHPRRGSRAR
jgi:hypothetical protein